MTQCPAALYLKPESSTAFLQTEPIQGKPRLAQPSEMLPRRSHSIGNELQFEVQLSV